MKTPSFTPLVKYTCYFSQHNSNLYWNTIIDMLSFIFLDHQVRSLYVKEVSVHTQERACIYREWCSHTGWQNAK